MSAISMSPDEVLRDAQRAARWDLLRDALRYAQRDAQHYAQREIDRYVQRNYDNPHSSADIIAHDSTIAHLRYRITARSHVFAFVTDLHNFASELRNSYGTICGAFAVAEGLAQRVANLAHGCGDPEDYEGASDVEGKHIYPRDHWATAAHLNNRVSARSDLFFITSDLMSLAISIRESHGPCGAAEKADRLAIYVEELAHGLSESENYDGVEEI